MHTRFSYMLYDDSNYHLGRARIDVLLHEIEYVTTRQRAWIVYVFLLFIFAGGGVNAVKIRTLTVPEYVELNNTSNEEDVNEDIFLDCDFEYKESERKQLEVKWYFKGEETFFYQWLPGHKPQLPETEIGRLFSKHIDLEHFVSEDPYKKHRSLLLKKPTVALSGDYECKVSTLLSEDRQKKEMKIYSKCITNISVV